MILAFTLSMPNNNSWNGKWSGAETLYVKVVNMGRSKAKIESAKALVDKGSAYHNFGDGWGASVSIEEVDAKEAAKLRKKSAGFCGYDWMVISLVKVGRIDYEAA